MAVNYSSKLPQDRNNAVMTGVSTPFPAIATVVSENATTSSVSTLNTNTTLVEVAAVGTGAGIRWASNQATSVIVAAGTANFDNFIPAGMVRTFVVPRFAQATGASSIGGIAGLNTSEGLYSGIAYKSAGIGSVLVTQY